MPEETKTSFIPKQAPVQTEQYIKSRPVGLITFISVIIFLVAVVAAGGAYFYKVTLEKKVTQQAGQLEIAKGAFEPALIEDMQRLDKRINSSRELLSGHSTVTPLFQALQDSTLKTVQYTKFSFTVDHTAGTVVNVEMAGKARNYKSIALQSDLLTQNKYIKDHIFSNLTLDERGDVAFDLMFEVNPSFLSYERSVDIFVSELEPPVAEGNLIEISSL